MDTWTAFPFGLFVNNVIKKSIYKYLFKSLLSILWGTHSETELVNNMVIPCLIFWGTVILFSWQPRHFTFLQAVHKSSNLSTSSPMLIFWFFKKIVAILTFILFRTPPLLITLPLANFRHFWVALLAFEVPLKQGSKFRNVHGPSDVDKCSRSLLIGKYLEITLYTISLVHWLYLFN